MCETFHYFSRRKTEERFRMPDKERGFRNCSEHNSDCTNSPSASTVRRATTQPDSDELSQTKLPELSISEASDWAKKNRKHLPDDWPLRSLKDRDCVSSVSAETGLILKMSIQGVSS